MSLEVIDKIIAREVGQLCWYLLPDIHPGLERDERDEAFRALWDPNDPEELRAVILENPPVEYPVIYLGLDVLAGVAPAPFLYPPSHGQALHLSEYLGVLRRFLILQLITGDNAHVDLLWRAVRTLAADVSKEELLHFVDQLWRGRWIVSARDWAHMRRSVITGGTEEAIQELENDLPRLEMEAVRLIEKERQLKEVARSMEEWLHEAYCLLPDIYTWFISIRHAKECHPSDELDKFDRILDEFLADISTTLLIPCLHPRNGRGLAEEYAIEPLRVKRSVEEAIVAIRGIYRGRSIIPRVWYEMAKNALHRMRLADLHKFHHDFTWGKRESGPLPLLSEDYQALNNVDLAQAFGRAITMDSKEFHWLFLSSLFDYWDTGDKQ